jgi:hypothetical protein
MLRNWTIEIYFFLNARHNRTHIPLQTLYFLITKANISTKLVYYLKFRRLLCHVTAVINQLNGWQVPSMSEIGSHRGRVPVLG